MKEALKQAGYTDEQIKQILDLHKKELDGNYEPKSRNEELRELNKALKDQTASLMKEVKSLGDAGNSSKELQEKLLKIEAENKEKEKTMQANFEKQIKYNAARVEYGSQVHDFDDFWGKLNADSLKLDDKGAIVSGLKEQVDTIRESKGYLFKPAADGTNNQPGNLKGFQPAASNAQPGQKGEAPSIGREMARSHIIANESMAAKAAAHFFGKKE